MKFATKFVVAAITVVLSGGVAVSDGMRENVLRDAAIRGGLTPYEDTHVPAPRALVLAGQLLFQTKKLSLDHQTACASCHVDKFGSADGIPNAIGTGGVGEGQPRLLAGGDIIPRNTLPFWGRGGKGFDVFFWDGKVDASSGTIHSQFAGQEPSKDPLVVAVHLPPVEVGEMVADSSQNDVLEGESVASAQAVYELLLERFKADGKIAGALSSAKGVAVADLTFLDAAEALAAFIRTNFQLRATRLHQFVYSNGNISPDEIAGGLIFYGKGRCISCHNGPYFTDFQFHSIPFPQAGSGKNGFGIDYGRFNVTLDSDDRFRFRTPPLYNVTRTAPYSHSGSIVKLVDAIRLHVDPLAGYSVVDMSGEQRVQFYEQLKYWSGEAISGVYLDEAELEDLIAFLGMLEYDSAEPVAETE